MDKNTEELTDKEKDYLLTILYKQDWTETEICDSIIRKLELTSHIENVKNKIENVKIKIGSYGSLSTCK